LLKPQQDLIKVRGWQVSPAELETCLFAHPAILDVAVIGVDFQDERGELPRAYVVLDPALAPTTTDDEIREFLIGKLSRYKALDGGVCRVKSLPRSSTGKVLKNTFKEEAKLEVVAARMKVGFTAEVTSPIFSFVNLVDEGQKSYIADACVDSHTLLVLKNSAQGSVGFDVVEPAIVSNAATADKGRSGLVVEEMEIDG